MPLALVLAALNAPPSTDLVFSNVLPLDYYKISDQVQLRKSRKQRYEYYSAERLLVIKAMPGPVHECVQDWFQHVINLMQQAGFIDWKDWLKYISRNVGMGKLWSFVLLKCMYMG